MIDREIDEKVMGNKRQWCYSYEDSNGERWEGCRYYDSEEKAIAAAKVEGATAREKYIPRYSTNIGDAFQVVEKMHDYDHYFELFKDRYGNWTAEFSRFNNPADNFYKVTADTAPLAICKAALKAKESEE